MDTLCVPLEAHPKGVLMFALEIKMVHTARVSIDNNCYLLWVML
jgi:hypothetical protein